MAEKQDIWMPLYIADYLADTTRLTTEQHGAYLLLIMDYWRNGPLPDNDSELAHITRQSVAAWRKVRPVIQRFFGVDGGEWRHKRIDAELERAKVQAQKKADKAKKAADARWKKEQQGASSEDAPSIAPSIAQGDASGDASGDAKDMHEECPSQSQSPGDSGTNESGGKTGNSRTPQGAVCARLRKAGITGVNPSHAKLLAMLGAGYGVDEIASIGEEPAMRGKPMAYVLSTAEGRRRDAAEVKPAPEKAEKPWFLSNSEIDMRAEKHGITVPWPYRKDAVFKVEGITPEMVRAAKIDWPDQVRG